MCSASTWLPQACPTEAHGMRCKTLKLNPNTCTHRCVVLVLGLRLARMGDVEPLTWRLARAWLPVNLLCAPHPWLTFQVAGLGLQAHMACAHPAAH